MSRRTIIVMAIIVASAFVYKVWQMRVDDVAHALGDVEMPDLTKGFRK